MDKNVRARRGRGEDADVGSTCRQPFQRAPDQLTRLRFLVGREAWHRAAGLVDAELSRLDARVDPDVGVLVTADHGVLDVPPHSNVAMDPALLVDVVGVAGDPRCRQLTVAPGTDVPALVDAFRASLGKRAVVASRDEAVAAGWFGPVDDAVLPRIGDVRQREGLEGTPPNLAAPPPGCRFHPRCPLAMPVCATTVPAMIETRPGHRVACHPVNPGAAA